MRLRKQAAEISFILEDFVRSFVIREGLRTESLPFCIQFRSDSGIWLGCLPNASQGKGFRYVPCEEG